MNNNTMLIIRREYLERVSKKSFIITTILMPLLMLALAFIPALVMTMQSPTERTIAVIDNSGIILPRLEAPDGVRYAATELPADSITHDSEHRYDFDGVLIVGSDIVSNPSDARLYMHYAVPMELESTISGSINSIVEEIRLRDYNIENLPQILAQVQADGHLQTFRIEDGEATGSSSAVSMVIGIVIAFILYMMIIMYGNMVMTSIIEEKNNRVLELIVSSVKPMQLMLGKIVGIGLVAVTQIAIWTALITGIFTLVLPAVIPADMLSQATMLQGGAIDTSATTYDPELLQAVGSVINIGYILSIMGWATLFLIGGFLLYAAMYAAIASSVDNIQDASQLSYIPTIPVIISFVFCTAVSAEPNSTMAIWLSMIPFTSPMLMVVRIPFGIGWYEIVASLVILYISFVFMVWFAGKIYRVGIFMYGKKPSVGDLIRWARYK